MNRTGPTGFLRPPDKLMERGGRTMTETKFTPGPWEASFTDCLGGPASYCRIRPESGEMFGRFTSMEIATMHTMDGAEQQANASLIAAAPELYEALEDLAFIRECCDETGYVDGEGFVDVEAVFEKARAALAKARGES